MVEREVLKIEITSGKSGEQRRQLLSDQKAAMSQKAWQLGHEHKEICRVSRVLRSQSVVNRKSCHLPQNLGGHCESNLTKAVTKPQSHATTGQSDSAPGRRRVLPFSRDKFCLFPSYRVLCVCLF